MRLVLEVWRTLQYFATTDDYLNFSLDKNTATAGSVHDPVPVCMIGLWVAFGAGQAAFNFMCSFNSPGWLHAAYLCSPLPCFLVCPKVLMYFRHVQHLALLTYATHIPYSHLSLTLLVSCNSQCPSS